ncbi:MAG TPA: DUF4352 domain-containing protein [Nitrososphaerales archaeon]
MRKSYVVFPIVAALLLIAGYSLISTPIQSGVSERTIWGVPSEQLQRAEHPQTRPPSVTSGLIGQLLHDGRMMFYVNDFSRGRVLGEGPLGVSASPGHEFIIIDLYIMNMGERPIPFSTKSLSLISEKVSYHASATTQFLRNGFNTPQIPAGLVARGQVAFEVPDSLTASWLYFTDYSSGFQVEMKHSPSKQSPPASTVDVVIPTVQIAKDTRIEFTISAVKAEMWGNIKRITADVIINNLAENGFQVNREFFHLTDESNYMYCPTQGETAIVVLPKEKAEFRGLVFDIPAESKYLSLIYSDYSSRFVFKLAE